MRHEGSTSYETEFKGTPPFTLTSLDGSRAIGSWLGSRSSQVVVSILQLDNPVMVSVVVTSCDSLPSFSKHCGVVVGFHAAVALLGMSSR